MTRLPHYRQVIVQIPEAFGTNLEQVIGPPGSQARDEFKEDIRKGEIVPANSRWV